MFALPRLTARLAAVASFAALLATACNTDSNGPSGPTLSADRAGNFNASRGPSQGVSTGFAVLANAAVTCTDGSIVGDVGTFQAKPTGAVTLTNCPVDGSIHVGDGAAKQAYNAFVAEYNRLADVPCDVVLTGTLANDTLAPGVYCFEAAAALTGQLTLNGPASGIWLFKIGNSAVGALTGTNFSVVMIGGGDPCNVTWWVDAAATLTDSHFLGNILAGAAITLTRGTFNGNAWAGAVGVGDVTITGTAVVGCEGSRRGPGGNKDKCNQGVGNGPEGCDPGDSNHHHGSNDENGGTPGNPGRKP
jgi:hypothetical protein